MQNIRSFIFLLLGVFLTIFIYQAVTIYQLRAIAAENRQIILNDRAILGNVIDFLQSKYPELKNQNTTAQPGTSAKPSTTGTTTKK